MKRFSFLLVVAPLMAATLLVSCESSNEIVTVFLRPNKAACADGGLCLIARGEDDDAYELVEYIRGFRFRWGYDYELKIELRREQGLGPAYFEWVLNDVAERNEAPDTAFELCLVTDMVASLDLENNRGWIGEELREFTFAEDIEAQVVAFQQKGFGLAGFEFASDVDDPLILTGISVDLEAPCEGPIPEYVPESPGGDPPAS